MDNGRPRNLSKNQANLLKMFNKTKTLAKNSKPFRKIVSLQDDGWLWTILYIVLTLTILFFLFSIVYHFLLNKESSTPPLPIIQTQPVQPKGVLDMPTQMGAPVSTEGPTDSTENSYLSLYGGRFAPGFLNPSLQQKYPIQGNSNVSYASYPNTQQSQPSDYYFEEEQNNIPRRELNEQIQQENNYIRSVNNRVREINRKRMYSPEFVKNNIELSQIRSLERRLANRVHREAEYQPNLYNN